MMICLTRTAVTATLVLISFTGLATLPIVASQEMPRPFHIQVIDSVTQRGVPLVQIRTVNHIRLVTDSWGNIAFDEPGLMNQRVFFFVSSDGYEYPKDRFGFRGVALNIRPGGKAIIKVDRTNVAERLYRVTGAGIYRDTKLLSLQPPIKQGLVNANVLGSDSVINATYKNKLYWFWGDTNRPGYPLGNFHVPGAVSQLPGIAKTGPDNGIDLVYFVDEKTGFAKETAKMPGKGPTWVFGLTVLKESGKERLLATYNKVKPPMEIYERGVIQFRDSKQRFDKLTSFPHDVKLFASGHPVTHVDEGEEYLYFPTPYPLVRVPATYKDYQNPSSYQAYTCLKEGARADQFEVEHDPTGKAIFKWRFDVIPWSEKLQKRLLQEGKIKNSDAIIETRDVDTQRPISIHGSSIYFNEFRNRWIMIGLEQFGTSPLGEIWYLESKDFHGPWNRAKKIVSHNKYSFYNPKQHPMFAHDNYIYFEGTYTTMFSAESTPTPRYNYNQIMYRLDLTHSKLEQVQSD